MQINTSCVLHWLSTELWVNSWVFTLLQFDIGKPSNATEIPNAVGGKLKSEEIWSVGILFCPVRNVELKFIFQGVTHI